MIPFETAPSRPGEPPDPTGNPAAGRRTAKIGFNIGIAAPGATPCARAHDEPIVSHGATASNPLGRAGAPGRRRGPIRRPRASADTGARQGCGRRLMPAPPSGFGAITPRWAFVDGELVGATVDGHNNVTRVDQGERLTWRDAARSARFRRRSLQERPTSCTRACAGPPAGRTPSWYRSMRRRVKGAGQVPLRDLDRGRDGTRQATWPRRTSSAPGRSPPSHPWRRQTVFRRAHIDRLATVFRRASKPPRAMRSIRLQPVADG